MAAIRIKGIDQTTGQQRPTSTNDTVVGNIGDSVAGSLRPVGDYSGGANIFSPTHPWSNPIKLADPSTEPVTVVRDVSFSSGGEYVAIGYDNTPRMLVYQRSGTTFSPLPTPASAPNNAVYGLEWSSNGEFLACAVYGGSTNLMAYQRDGNTLTKLTDPSSLPGSQCTDVSWSANGQYLACTTVASPYMFVYERDGTILSPLNDPSSIPQSSTSGAAWSPNGRYLVITFQTSPFIAIYRLDNGNTLTRLANPSSIPLALSYGPEWSPDGKILGIGYSAISPYHIFYKVDGETYTPFTLPDFPITDIAIAGGNASANKIAWHPSGNYVAIAHGPFGGGMGYPYISIYERDNDDNFTRLADPASTPNNQNWGVGWSPDGQFVIAGGHDSGNLMIYQTTSTQPSQGIFTMRGM